MTDQVVTLDQIITLAGIVMAVGSGLTMWMIKRIDKVTEAVNALRIRDVEAEAAAAKEYATRDELGKLEQQLTAELTLIRKELSTIHRDIAGKLAAE